MRAVVIVVAVTSACGRLGFDLADDDPRCLGGNDDDGDGIADDCDRCPGVPDRGQFDRDQDGVGDGCDPSSGIEQLAMFDPFVGDTLDPRWSPTGEWTIAESRAITSAGATASAISYVLDPIRSEVGVRGDLTAIKSGPRQVSLQYGNAETDEAEYCELFFETNPGFKLMRFQDGSFEQLARRDVDLVTGRFALRFRHGPDGFSCTVAIGGTTTTIEAATTFIEPRGRAYFQVINVDVELDSFSEVASEP